MSLSRRFVVLCVVSLFLVATGAVAQDGSWRVKGDNGETVRVLPPPAAVAAQANHGAGQQLPTQQNGYSVFSASYGSVPGQMDDHGGSVISNASFQPIFYDGPTAASLQSGIDSFETNLTSLFNGGRIAVSTSTIYGVYLPNGTVSTMGSSRSCTSYCGYHSSYTYNGKTIIYAVFPYNDCSSCSLSGKTVVDMETIVTSHEIREAITDPVNAWWEASSGYEDDDKCAWHNLYQQTGGAWVQPEYSNALAGWPRGCVTP